jgi:hypothetical protein
MKDGIEYEEEVEMERRNRKKIDSSVLGEV